jgi:hypothetical protein
MSKEKPNEDPHQQPDWKNTEQTDQPWKGPVEREQRNEDRITWKSGTIPIRTDRPLDRQAHDNWLCSVLLSALLHRARNLTS